MTRIAMMMMMSLGLMTALASAKEGPPVTEELVSALFEDDVEPLKQYLGAGGNPDATDDGSTLLIQACNNGSLECMKLLLDSGADANRASESGETPLLRAAGSLYRAGLDSVKLLVERGADVNKTFPKGTTALMKVTSPPAKHYEDDYLAALEYLISKGADVNARLKTGETALSFAKEGKLTRFVKALKKAGAK